MRFIYALVIKLYGWAIHLSALFNKKAKDRIEGLKLQKMVKPENLAEGGEIIWMHCASVGEFEQGRPVFEGLKIKFPECYFLLTFFSSSGFNAAKNYKEADKILYMPLDTYSNAKKFIGDIKFKMVLFIKYEFWFAHISFLQKRKIPIYLVSGIFRPDQLFFKGYGKWFLRHLKYFHHFFVQNEESKLILNNAGIKQVTISGDTRADRVLEISKKNFEALSKPPSILTKTIVCGSIWPVDETIILEQINHFKKRLKWILVPHEINSDNVLILKSKIEKTGLVNVSLFSEPNKNHEWDVLIVNAVGYLSKLYRMGDMAYVGGGFGKGIHNLLEPIAYGIPVMFGPKNEKFREAADLINCGGGVEVLNAGEMKKVTEDWLADEEKRKKNGEQALGYLKKNAGATKMIIAKIAGN